MNVKFEYTYGRIGKSLENHLPHTNAIARHRLGCVNRSRDLCIDARSLNFIGNNKTALFGYILH